MGFFLKGNLQAMQATIDNRLNFMSDRPNQKYFVASDRLLFSFTTSEYGQSMTDDKNKGISSEKAFIAFILLADCTLHKDKWVADQLAAFIPYVLVDNPFSLVVGRETYGFPKSIGNILIPRNTEFPYNFNTETLGFRTFNEQARSYVAPWINVSKQLDKNDHDHGVLTDQNTFWKHLRHQFGHAEKVDIDLKFIIKELENLWHREVPLVFLKQFRDISDATKACYQSIIETHGIVTKFRGGDLLGQYDINISHLDTLPIETDLGLPSRTATQSSFRVEVDMTFQAGKEIWNPIP